jgi:hypothetical protein
MPDNSFLARHTEYSTIRRPTPILSYHIDLMTRLRALRYSDSRNRLDQNLQVFII